MSNEYPPPCVHNGGAGLCELCRREFEEDPGAYVEFGEHPAGRANFAALEAEMREFYLRNASFAPAPRDSEIPF